MYLYVKHISFPHFLCGFDRQCKLLVFNATLVRGKCGKRGGGVGVGIVGVYVSERPINNDDGLKRGIRRNIM